MRILGLLATKFRYGLCRHFPKIALWIYSKHRGECNHCGDCCIYCGYNNRIARNGKFYCKDNDNKPLAHQVAPFPFDLWWDEKYKNCSIYYFRKR